jgi:hypothetical protein
MRGRGSLSDEFIREVDEAVRQDRWLKLWQHYGSYIIGAALALVIGTAAGVGWRTYQESQSQSDARRYAAATDLLRQDRAAEAAEAFAAIADDAGSGYSVLARLRAAQALAEAGDEAAKTAALSDLAEDGDAPDLYRELSGLLTAQEDLENLDPETLVDRLEPLADPDQPWRYSARELEALAQMRAGQTDAARRVLGQLLGDPGTPPNLARRAAELLAAMGGPMPDQQPAEGAAPASGEASATGEPSASGSGQ